MHIYTNNTYFINEINQNLLTVLNEEEYLSVSKIKEFVFNDKSTNDQKTLISEMIKAYLSARVSENLLTVVNTSEMNQGLINSLKNIVSSYHKEVSTIELTDNIEVKNSNIIDSNLKLDVIGDIHGLYDSLIEHLEKLGYSKDGIHKDKNRKLLFLGDLVDRGPDSLKILKLAMLFKRRGHFFIAGNHENKTLFNLLQVEKGIQPKGGMSNKELIYNISKNKKDLKRIKSFLENLEPFYIQDNFVFVHANINDFDIRKTGRSTLIYGSNRSHDFGSENIDDELYEKNGKYKLIRGHVRSKNTYKKVFSVDYGQAFNGQIASIRLNEINDDNYLDALTLTETNFDANTMRNENILYDIKKLLDLKLITKKAKGLYNVYKYTSKVSEERIWLDHDINQDLLRNCRGLVLDYAGNIICNPPTKVFNYFEYNKTISPDTEIIAVKKENGFLVNISYDKVNNKLLYTTTNGIDTPHYVTMAQSFIDYHLSHELRLFTSRNNITLSFEVIHKSDPHIIVPKKFKISLIGAKKRNSIHDKALTETELDSIANELGLERPEHFKTTYGKLQLDISNVFHEGFMIRKSNDSQDTIMKYKSPFYMIKKYYKRKNYSNIVNTEKVLSLFVDEIAPFKSSFVKINEILLDFQNKNIKITEESIEDLLISNLS